MQSKFIFELGGECYEGKKNTKENVHWMYGNET